MAKKQYFAVCDTETTIDGKVADFAMVICDRKGEIVAQCAVMVNGIFTDSENHALFYDEKAGDLWNKKSLARRYNRYNEMVNNGSRMIASVNAINVWIAKAIGKYDPILTAYNLAFDVDKCRNTGINLDEFSSRFCLWHSAVNRFVKTKKYRNFVLKNHAFNAPTKKGNMSFKTNAEIMARFVLNDENLADEPHTALEDVIDYEIPILVACVKNRAKKEILNPPSFNWRMTQAKDHFTAK